MDWLTFGVPVTVAAFGLVSLCTAWLLSLRFHRKHPRHLAERPKTAP